MPCNAFVLHTAENSLKWLVMAMFLDIIINSILEMQKQTKWNMPNTLSVPSLIQHWTWEI